MTKRNERHGQPRDVLDGKVSLSANATKTGIELSSKSRFIMAIDRLAGNVVDIPGSYLEHIRDRRRFIATARSMLYEKAHQVFKDRLDADPRTHSETPSSYDFVIDKIVGDLMKGYENGLNIAAGSIEYIERRGSEDFDDSGKDIDEDWMEMFISLSKGCTSRELQQMWSLVLGSEILNPGQITRTALRVVSEIDKETAKIFQEISGNVLIGGHNDGFIPRNQNMRDDFYHKLLDLADSGLTHTNPIGLSTVHFEDDLYIVKNGDKALLFRWINSKKSDMPVIPSTMLTKAGRQVLSILPRSSAEIPLRHLAQCMDRNDCVPLQIHNIVTDKKGFVIGDPIEKIV